VADQDASGFGLQSLVQALQNIAQGINQLSVALAQNLAGIFDAAGTN
jgi:hypothetical protein